MPLIQLPYHVRPNNYKTAGSDGSRDLLMNGSNGGGAKPIAVNDSMLTDDDCLPPCALLANDAMYPTTQALISDHGKPTAPNVQQQPTNIRPLNPEDTRHCITDVTEPRHVNRSAPHQQRYLKESSGYSSSSASTVQMAGAPPPAPTSALPQPQGSRPMAFVRSINNDGLEPTKRSSAGSGRGRSGTGGGDVRFASADTLHEDQEYKISV